MIAFSSFYDSLSPELGTLLIAMIPVVELRGALPLAIETAKLSVPAAFFWSVLGNMIPVVFIVWLLNPFSAWLRRHFKIFDRFFTWLFDRTREKFYHQHQKWGEIGLVIFVAIPLPATGAWTGAVAAFLFGIPLRRSIFLLLLGVIFAGVIVSLLTVGISQLVSVLSI